MSPAEKGFWVGLAIACIVFGLVHLLPGCAIDTEPPPHNYRWYQSEIAVCAEPELAEATAAAAAAWTAGPAFTCRCPGEVVVGYGDPHGQGETIADIERATGEIYAAEVEVSPEDGLDLQAIITHELGHVLGLDHTAAAGATMNPSIGAEARTLSEHDVEMVEWLYGR